MTVIFIIFGMGSFSSFWKWRSFIPIKENEPQAKPQTSQTGSILHRTRSRGRSEPPMNNGAIFVKRVAPSFLSVMPPASRVFLFLDENFAPAIRRQPKRIRLDGIVLYENSRWAKLAAMSSGSEKLSPFGKSLDENWKPTHGSLLAAQPSEAAASARMESLSWRKYIFRQ